MSAALLAPFARSLALEADFHFPEGAHETRDGGRAWWPRDDAAAIGAMGHGPRDLFAEYPIGRMAARERLLALLHGPIVRGRGKRLVLVGFSQGGMLACDALLCGDVNADGLVLLSSSRIAFDEWQPQLPKLRGLPVLVAHGRHDHDLAFAAGERLRDCLLEAGALVKWVPFDGGHQMPLPVWRELRKFVSALHVELPQN